MNRVQAMRALQRLYGRKAMWRYDERAPSAEEREAARERIPALKSTADAAKAAVEARRAELLKDPEYVRLREVHATACAERDDVMRTARWYRVTVGHDSLGGIAFCVTAQGDNWQDAIDKATAKEVQS